MNTNEVLRENWQEIRQKLGNLISWIDGQIDSLDAKEKRLEKLENESYIRGAQDMREAAISILEIPKYGGMSCTDIRTCFDEGISFTSEIFKGYEALDIIERVRKWRADEEAEEAENAKADDIQVGDEVEIDFGAYSINGIVTKLGDEYANVAEQNLYGIGVDVVCHRKNALKKTGRHFDNIPFDYGVKGETE